MYSVSLVLSVCLASFYFASGEDRAYVKTIKAAVAHCAPDYGLEDETMKQIVRLKNNMEHENEKCFAGCVLEHMSFIKDNHFDSEALRKITSSEYKNEENQKKAKSLVETCHDKVSANENKCILGYEILKCITETAKTLELSYPRKSTD